MTSDFHKKKPKLLLWVNKKKVINNKQQLKWFSKRLLKWKSKKWMSRYIFKFNKIIVSCQPLS